MAATKRPIIKISGEIELSEGQGRLKDVLDALDEIREKLEASGVVVTWRVRMPRGDYGV